VIGAALALVASRPASATTTSGLSDSDLANVDFAIALELTARDLYQAAIDAGATGEVWSVMATQHASAAQLLAGISGISADHRNDAVFDALVGGFTTTTSASAFDLENVAAATHVELLSKVVDPQPAAAIASIAAIESRQANVLAGLAGRGDDFDALFLNTATPLSPEA
jgi:rubrerythrin